VGIIGNVGDVSRASESPDKRAATVVFLDAVIQVYQAHAEIFSWLCKKPYNYEGCVRRM